MNIFIYKLKTFMKRENYEIASGLVDRIDNLEKTIFSLQDLSKCKQFTIIGDAKNIVSDGGDDENNDVFTTTINLDSNEMATEIFVETFLEYYIGLLNLELNELRKEFDEL